MARARSNIVVYGAIAGNVAVAVTKFVAAALTGSSAMLSEGIHSTVDTGDGLLILLGMRLSRKPPDDTHPVGYGRELYFWVLIVGVLIFGVGGGVSFYEGLLRAMAPAPIEKPLVSYVVLGISAVFEGISWSIAVREFRREQKEASVWQTIRRSKDPTTFVVLFEDSAALLGLLVAFLGIFLGVRYGLPQLDGIASMVIGVLLASVALIMIHETRGLIIGESADPAVIASVRGIVTADEAVERIRRPLTLHVGPDYIVLALEIEFRDGLTSDDLERAVERLERAIRSKHPQIRQIFLEARAIASGMEQARRAGAKG